MVIQGSNESLVITFDESVENMAKMLVTIWLDSEKETLVKSWRETDMQIAQNTIVCPLSEAETAAFPPYPLTVEIKGLDADGTTVIYEAIPIEVVARHDGSIPLTEGE